jgi:hypothetical protein
VGFDGAIPAALARSQIARRRPLFAQLAGKAAQRHRLRFFLSN